MRARFWGTRGSIPKPGPSTLRHGGNTACVEVETAAGTLIVIDGGTGVHDLGHAIARRRPGGRGHLLISHTHWDHIQGLPFFAPLWIAGGEWDVYAPHDPDHSLYDVLAGQMKAPFFPVALTDMQAKICLHTLEPGRLQIDDVAITTQTLNHPARTLGYRLEADGAALVYACDHEPFEARLAVDPGPVTGADARHADFLAGADLVIHDAQYCSADYAEHVGWGHATLEYAAHIARTAGAKAVAMTHHDPMRSDDALDALMAELRAGRLGDGPTQLIAAAEGTEFILGG